MFAIPRKPGCRARRLEAKIVFECCEANRTSEAVVVHWTIEQMRSPTGNPGNQTLLRMLIADRLGDDPTIDNYRRLVKAVIQSGGIVTVRTIKNQNGEVVLPSGQYEFVERTVEPEPEVEPEVPRDHTGKPLECWSARF
jgi:hypothetical protein